MAKSSKKKYNPKVSFNGSFEDLLGLTFNNPKTYKFKIGDVVTRKSDDALYIITGSKETGTMAYGADYAIQPKDDKTTTLFIKEDEINSAE